jgi:endoglucanase
MRNGMRLFAGLIIGLVSVGVVLAQNPGGGRELARGRAGHLRRGVNLSEWWAQVYDPRGYVKEHFETWTTAADIELIRKIGFDHVRLSVNPGPMFKRNEADLIPADYLAELDASVKMILDSGLAVMLDLHPEEDFKQKLSGDAFVEQYADFWRAFAKHYSSWDADRVFFETLNEPEVRDPYRWYGIQMRLVEAIREAAPQHSVIVEGARWADDDDLVFMEPLRDGNVIYNFHFYEPHIFTHQGATWGANSWHYVRGLPYPSDPENVKAVAGLVPDEFNRLQVMRYGADRWGPARINLEFDAVAEWAKKWDVAVVCNEFGAYRKAARAEDREAWIRDVRTALEKHGFGWTMWDYSGGFGVVSKKDGSAVVVDEGTVRALGLKMP